MADTWWDYVQRISGGASQSEIARRIGLTSASVSRWRHSAPQPDNVRAFARAYGRPALEALVAAGIVTEEDVEGVAEDRDEGSGRRFADPDEQSIWDAATGIPEDERLALIAYLRSYRQLRENDAR